MTTEDLADVTLEVQGFLNDGRQDLAKSAVMNYVGSFLQSLISDPTNEENGAVASALLKLWSQASKG